MTDTKVAYHTPVYNEEPVEYTGEKDMPIEVPQTATVIVPSADDAPKTDLMGYASLIVALITLIATFCVTMLGWEPLPYSSEQINFAVVAVLQVASTLWAWFRNNNVTKHGKQRQQIADQVMPERKGVK